MQTTESTLQLSYEDALELFLKTDPNYGGGLANHGPMAVEALVNMGMAHQIGPFVDYYRPRLEDAREHVPPAPIDWREWLRPTLAPLVAAAANRAGHGLLRVAHAVRAIERADASGSVALVHRQELATAVEYWRTGGPGLRGPEVLTGSLTPRRWVQTLGRLRPVERSDGLLTQTLETASARSGFVALVAWLAPAADPIANFDALGALAAGAFARNRGLGAFALLHGTTVSAMASVLVPSLDAASVRRLEAAVAGFVAAAVIGFDEPEETMSEPAVADTPSAAELAEAAGASKEDHTIKFVDACIAIATRSGDNSILRAAARQVVQPYGGGF